MSSSVQASVALEVLDGPHAGQCIALDQIPGIVGRATTCDVRLDDPYVSRTHCLIDRVGQLLYVKDLDSRNGIHVDGVRASQTFLRCGSVLRIGESVIRVRLAPEEGSFLANASVPESLRMEEPPSCQRRSYSADATTEDWNELRRGR